MATNAKQWVHLSLSCPLPNTINILLKVACHQFCSIKPYFKYRVGHSRKPEMRVSVQPRLPGACSPGLHIWGCGPLPEPGLIVPGAWRVLCKPIAVTALGDRQELAAIPRRRKTEAQRGSGTDRRSHGKCPLGRNPVPGPRRTIRKSRLSFRVPFLCHLDSSLNIQDK